MTAFLRFPVRVRHTANGCALLIYNGGARRRSHWSQQPPWSAVSRRRYSWQVHRGGRT